MYEITDNQFCPLSTSNINLSGSENIFCQNEDIDLSETSEKAEIQTMTFDNKNRRQSESFSCVLDEDQGPI